ncbi:flavodoxin family protein [Phosphitispora fastidiosa]|uniref:flavodoxin family protein n=1 Tax=Phosphitispora fastidiosa TaxID=2837202 RepID=UPI001E632F26|nr:NAD(P)H-dependent oxidoreductase [Phosphitispora fastidiosa]MBU7005198.1 multimeric flavodoxin WrbA [Phosphitispora fastidiosa]
MKITAVVGSPHKGQTYRVVKTFADELKKHGEVDFEYIFLNDLNLQLCRGCGICLEKGEEYCPLHDDLKAVSKTLMESDGVVFAAPVYSLQVPAQLKILLDRMAYVFHRPCFFGKTFMPIVTQGVYGDKEVLKYLGSVAQFWGFKLCRGVGVTTPLKGEPTAAQQQTIALETAKAANQFHELLTNPEMPAPGIKELMIFRFVRTSHKSGTGLPADYEYFKANGWFETDYFYETKLGLIKRAIGWWADRQSAKQGEKTRKQQAELV